MSNELISGKGFKGRHQNGERLFNVKQFQAFQIMTCRFILGCKPFSSVAEKPGRPVDTPQAKLSRFFTSSKVPAFIEPTDIMSKKVAMLLIAYFFICSPVNALVIMSIFFIRSF